MINIQKERGRRGGGEEYVIPYCISGYLSFLSIGCRLVQKFRTNCRNLFQSGNNNFYSLYKQKFHDIQGNVSKIAGYFIA